MPLPQEKRYTYADLRSWDGPERYEIIDGELYMLSAPKRPHQRVVLELGAQISAYLRGKRCEVNIAPFDVFLFADETTSDFMVDTVVQPDITIVCDPKKLSDDGCKGAPDMVVEILSPSTQKRDRFDKYHLYQKAGVKEYWLIDPDTKILQVFWMENGRYSNMDVYSENDTVKVNVLDNCVVDLSTVFDY